MKTNHCLAVVAALAAFALLTGCQSTPPKSAGEIVVRLTSESPVSYAGTVNVDGLNHAVSGVTPATLNYHGRQADCDLRKVSGSGSLQIEIEVGGRTVTLTESGSNR
jgi:hypothetical protein